MVDKWEIYLICSSEFIPFTNLLYYLIIQKYHLVGINLLKMFVKVLIEVKSSFPLKY